jgi:chaperonin cofactor prefoldin
MSFKDRMLKLAQNPYTLLGIGGAGLGAVYNYATDGAANLEQERAQDVQDFLTKEAPSDITYKTVMPKDDYSELHDLAVQKNNVLGRIPGISWLTGTTEDLHPLTWSKETIEQDIKEFIKNHPEANIETKDGDIFINGYKVGDTLNADNDYSNFGKFQEDKVKQLTPKEIELLVSKDKDLSSELKELKSSVPNATRDSYIQSALGGAALGTGATFAAKKLMGDKTNDLPSIPTTVTQQDNVPPSHLPSTLTPPVSQPAQPEEQRKPQ